MQKDPEMYTGQEKGDGRGRDNEGEPVIWSFPVRLLCEADLSASFLWKIHWAFVPPSSPYQRAPALPRNKPVIHVRAFSSPKSCETTWNPPSPALLLLMGTSILRGCRYSCRNLQTNSRNPLVTTQLGVRADPWTSCSPGNKREEAPGAGYVLYSA